MRTYGGHRPTGFDSHIPLEDREQWLIVPVSQTRDSGALERANFAEAVHRLTDVDPDAEDWETHRFGHWGPGWYDIIIVRPETAAAGIGESIEASLDAYPVLCEHRLSELESEEESEAWQSWALSDWRRALLEECDLDAYAWPDAACVDLYYEAARVRGTYPETGGDGPHFGFDRVAEDVTRGMAAGAIRNARQAAREAKR